MGNLIPFPAAPRTLLIACGALAREILELIQLNGWQHMDVSCLPAKLHNTPQAIPELVREKIRDARETHDQVLAVYGDCGTGGLLDAVLEEEGVERIPGPHCYAFFSGVDAFLESADADPFCFYLTDYLARHFELLIVRGLGIDRHPELLEAYFGKYKRLVYLAQSDDSELRAKAEAAAERLGLDFEYRWTGFGELDSFLRAAG
jgi:hypothetical protein